MRILEELRKNTQAIDDKKVAQHHQQEKDLHQKIARDEARLPQIITEIYCSLIDKMRANSLKGYSSMSENFSSREEYFNKVENRALQIVIKNLREAGLIIKTSIDDSWYPPTANGRVPRKNLKTLRLSVNW